MGITSRLALRYPEATALANTIHTQIKNLAEDVDSKLDFPSITYDLRGAGESTPHGAWYDVIYWVPGETDSRIPWNGTSTFTLTDAGIYAITANVMFRSDVSSSGIRGALIASGGAQIAGAYTPPIDGQADYVSVPLAVTKKFAANSSIRISTLQTSGGAVMLHGSPWTRITIARVA